MAQSKTPLAPLKAAIRAALLADAAFVTALGGTHVYDEVPRNIEPPYGAFGDAQSRENGTASGPAHQSDMILTFWSRQGGTAEALALAERAEAILDLAALAPAGHRLILLRVSGVDLRQEAGRGLFRASLRLRALTEVL